MAVVARSLVGKSFQHVSIDILNLESLAREAETLAYKFILLLSGARVRTERLE